MFVRIQYFEDFVLQVIIFNLLLSFWRRVKTLGCIQRQIVLFAISK